MTAPIGFVEALWVGSFEAEAPGGVILTPGVTLLTIPEGEALESDNWRFPVPQPATEGTKPKETS